MTPEQALKVIKQASEALSHASYCGVVGSAPSLSYIREAWDPLRELILELEPDNWFKEENEIENPKLKIVSTEETLSHPENQEISTNLTKEDIEKSDCESNKSVDEQKYVVRLFDMFDGWIDVSGAISKEEAEIIWNQKTKCGTKKINFSEGSYYDIFPANTRMVFTPESLGR